VDARDVIVTDANFGAARPQLPAIREHARRYLAPLLAAGRIPVLGGFIGATSAGATTTLGRGGSDYTASLVGAALPARAVQIWTDVDGVYTADPRVVDDPMLIPFLSFHEAYELARFGAKVLHWGTLEPAAAADIPVCVVNARRRSSTGTEIGSRPAGNWQRIAGLAHQAGVTIVDARPRGVVGSLPFLQTAMRWLEHHGHAANIVVLSATRMVVAVADAASGDALAAALRDVASVSVLRSVGLVAVVGDAIGSNAAAWRLVEEARAAGHVDAVLASQSGDALVCITGRPVAPRVLAHLHGALFAEAGAGA
jgi:aspartate kinase